jgi:hypothetical protein
VRKIIILVLGLAACSSQPGPKDYVFEFIDAVKSSDSLRIERVLDIESYVRAGMQEMSPQDSAVVLNAYRDSTIQSLLGDGDVRGRWISSLIVVNKEEKQDTLAEVEVSFVDQSVGHQLYTKMQLRKQPDGAWKVTFFR